jgi:hypothetical protein
MKKKLKFKKMSFFNVCLFFWIGFHFIEVTGLKFNFELLGIREKKSEWNE